MLTSRHLALCVASLGLVGCRAEVDTRPPARADYTLRYDQPARSENERLRNYASDVQHARNRTEEAEALRRFHDYLADHDLTYHVSGVSTVDNRAVDSMSTSNQILRVRVETFRGQQPLEVFTFVPKDNRNLALLGR